MNAEHESKWTVQLSPAACFVFDSRVVLPALRGHLQVQKELDAHLLVTRLAHVPRLPSEGPLREVVRDFGSLRSGSNKNNRLTPRVRDGGQIPVATPLFTKGGDAEKVDRGGRSTARTIRVNQLPR